MPLSEQELERIGILACRVLDGEASEPECADLVRLRGESAEVRELCAELEAGHAAFGAGVGSAPLPDGFAAKISFRAMQEPVATTALSAGRVGLYWGAAAAGIAAAVLVWMSLQGPDGDPAGTGTRRPEGETAKQQTPRTPGKTTPKTPRTGGTDSLFPERVKPARTPISAPDAAPDTTLPPAPEQPLPPTPTVVEVPTLPTPEPSTPERALPPERPEVPQPAPAATAVVVASVEQLDGRALAVLQQEGAEWATIGSDDANATAITAGSQLRASEGYVSLALQHGGFAALDRGAEIGFVQRSDSDRVRLRVGKGHVFLDLDERADGLTADCGIATVQLEPGSRVALDVSTNEVNVTVLAGNAVVLGSQEGAEPKRVGRHAGLKVNRHGRSGLVSKRTPRMRNHERRFQERRFKRAGAMVFGRESGWGSSGAAIERQARELMAAGATPRDLMPLLMRAQKSGCSGGEAMLLLRAFEAAGKQGLSRERTGRGLHRVLMQRLRGKELEGALARWLQNPEAPQGPPDRAGKHGRGPRRGGAAGKAGKPDKPQKPQKPNKQGKNKGMAGAGRRG